MERAVFGKNGWGPASQERIVVSRSFPVGISVPVELLCMWLLGHKTFPGMGLSDILGCCACVARLVGDQSSGIN